ncbi:NADP-dependent oxidoreductase [Serratia proteamaculans]|uniref:NADP-dependent oxidoreductase n=1 Tax=Serratia proteamaculans TaxID=28151 RepID=UPI001C56B2D2|nr:NADP-dependent oxidoreductase [Serratia proteamaculans]WEO90269.1 NADP-dependent oxidoreductase [Serratia proteamaculans]
MRNRQIILTELPQDKLTAQHFHIHQTSMPVPRQGEVLLRALYFPLDAASRAWMQGTTYRAGLATGDVMSGLALAEVVESYSPQLAVGDLVLAETGWQTFSVSPAEHLMKLSAIEPITHLLSIYGVPGLTAYFGLLECGMPKAGQTVVVTAAAGAVGAFVGQIARIKGCRTIGIAGGAKKCALLTRELGFQEAIDYKAGNLNEALHTACPEGIDVFFDNVGGDILEAGLLNMASYGRIVCCGAISQYDAQAPTAGPLGVPGMMIIKSLTMRGFLLSDFLANRERAIAELTAWVAAGELVVPEDILEGFDKLPTGLIGLLAGENVGKRLVKVMDDA